MTRTEVVRDYGGVSADVRRAERRRKLLTAGRQIWGELGLENVTVRGVIASSGLTPRYFYEHFTDRDALILAVAVELRDEIVATLVTSGIAESGGLEQKFYAALTAFFEVVAADPRVHRILASDPAGAVGLPRQVAQSLELVTDLLVEHGTPLFDVPPPDAELRRAALFVVGGVNQLIEAWLRDPRESPAAFAAVCTRLCLATLGATGQPLP
jgi:AcrR family transcriptional regulator